MANTTKTLLTERNGGHRCTLYLPLSATCGLRNGHQVELAPAKVFDVTSLPKSTAWYLLQGYCIAISSVSVVLFTPPEDQQRKKELSASVT